MNQGGRGFEVKCLVRVEKDLMVRMKFWFLWTVCFFLFVLIRSNLL